MNDNKTRDLNELYNSIIKSRYNTNGRYGNIKFKIIIKNKK